MEQESFEEKSVAELLNKGFVSIKVDREERPDIDSLYMNICQMMTGSGGWPLTIVMTPDKKPFFSATYIPKNNKYGMAGMMTLLPRITKMWKDDRKKLEESSEEIMSYAAAHTKDEMFGELDESILDSTFNALKASFDSNFGGFNKQPKFPMAHHLMFLLRYYNRSKNEEALKMVVTTLKSMRCGGIYDQVGYGFHRYSTDREWLVPHFEKMLYDQAMLANIYLETYQVTGDDFFKRASEEIFEYVLRDMTSIEGGFYSAEDADSEEIEGKYYVWTEKELKEVLTEDELKVAKDAYRITEAGNFELEKIITDKEVNILTYNPNVAEDKLSEIRKKLFNIRESRIKPYKDNKILTDWNGLMIAALSKGYKILNNDKLLEAAKKATDFILAQEPTFKHRFRIDKWDFEAMLDDYAFIIWGLLELYEASFEAHYLTKAIELNDIVIKDFWDTTGGGFFIASERNLDLPLRNKDYYDNAIPSGNSVMFLNLVRLFRITSNNGLEALANKLIQSMSQKVIEMPTAFTYFLQGYDYISGTSKEIILTGKKEESKIINMKKEINKRFIPNKVVILKENNNSELLKHASYLENYENNEEVALAYVCTNFSCSRPVNNVDDLIKLL